MALGDLATIGAVQGSVTVGITFTCTNDGTVNTTPQVTRPLGNVTGVVIYGAVACKTCGKTFLIEAQADALTIAAQQTS